jgi:hypothetical protein
MMLKDTDFIPREHGFRFVNHFEFSFDFKLPFGVRIDLGDIVYGLCGGMCFAALDYFNFGEPVPTISEVEDIGRDYLTYLWDRQLDSLRLPVVPKVIEWMLRDDNDIGRTTARWEVPKMRRRIDKGAPVVLALIRVSLGESATKNHQVLATGYELKDATKQLTIHVYDPNHPLRKPTLTMDLARPSRGINAKQSTGEPLRGFFIIKYKPQRPPAEQ